MGYSTCVDCSKRCQGSRCKPCETRRRNREKYDLLAPKSLSDEQEQLIFGSLLGDGHITRPKNNSCFPSFTEGHCEAQREYLEWKAGILYSIGSRVRCCPGGRKSPLWVMSTGRSALLGRYRDLFYPDGVKVCPDAVLDKLSPLGLAVWFMDDCSFQHSRYFVLCTDCWPVKDQHRIARWFSNRWGVVAVVFRMNHSGKWRLRFRVDDSIKLLNVMKPFLHPIFQDKWKVNDAATYKPAPTLQERAAVMNAKRTALIRAGVFRVGYHTGTVRV